MTHADSVEGLVEQRNDRGVRVRGVLPLADKWLAWVCEEGAS